jgi:hypothetical protein
METSGLRSNPSAAAADPVQAGREALRPWQGYPWYDKASDGVARVELVAEPEARETRSTEANLSLPAWDTILQGTAWLAIGLVLAWMAYLLARYWIARRPGSPPRQSPRREVDARVEALPEALRPAQGDLLTAAREAFAAGDYSRAVLYLFAHQLLELDRHQAICLARGKTNRQYLRELGGQNGLREIFAHSMVAFEDVFFGRQTIDRARCEACWAGQERLQTLLARTQA